jgi:hypothetical protein
MGSVNLTGKDSETVGAAKMVFTDYFVDRSMGVNARAHIGEPEISCQDEETHLNFVGELNRLQAQELVKLGLY